jgi:hypothetical protein
MASYLRPRRQVPITGLGNTWSLAVEEQFYFLAPALPRSKVRVVAAPPIDAIYGNPGFGGMMYTAGSNAVRSYYQPLRTFGAQVRRVLLDNAANKLGVPVDELTTEPTEWLKSCKPAWSASTSRMGRRFTTCRVASSGPGKRSNRFPAFAWQRPSHDLRRSGVDPGKPWFHH